MTPGPWPSGVSVLTQQSREEYVWLQACRSATCTARGHLGHCHSFREARLNWLSELRLRTTQNWNSSCVECPRAPGVCLSLPPLVFGD